MMKYVDAAVCSGCRCRFRYHPVLQPVQPAPYVHTEVDGKAAVEVLAEDQTDTWLATPDGFPVPGVREGSAGSDHRAARRSGTKLLHEKVGEVKAEIIERDGQVWMVKECPQHGKTEDLMAIDVKFLEWIEKNFPGRDIPAHNDEGLHNHGSSTIKHGRGSVLTVDLTNRCNMMCDPCFMDANQVGYVHELTWGESRRSWTTPSTSSRGARCPFSSPAASRPCRPTFWMPSPMPASSATPALRPRPTVSSSPRARNSRRRRLKPAFDIAYLQFDGIGNDANSHRQIGNLFDVKLRAIENLHEAGVEIILVVTLVNGVNNDQVGSIIRFAMDNPKKIAFIAFQPVSFTGRDEDITPERRLRQRYTLVASGE